MLTINNQRISVTVRPTANACFVGAAVLTILGILLKMKGP